MNAQRILSQVVGNCRVQSAFLMTLTIIVVNLRPLKVPTNSRFDRKTCRYTQNVGRHLALARCLRFTNHEISKPQGQSTMDASNTRYGRVKSENVDKKMTIDIREENSIREKLSLISGLKNACSEQKVKVDKGGIRTHAPCETRKLYEVKL